MSRPAGRLCLAPILISVALAGCAAPSNNSQQIAGAGALSEEIGSMAMLAPSPELRGTPLVLGVKSDPKDKVLAMHLQTTAVDTKGNPFTFVYWVIFDMRSSVTSWNGTFDPNCSCNATGADLDLFDGSAYIYIESAPPSSGTNFIPLPCPWKFIRTTRVVVLASGTEFVVQYAAETGKQYQRVIAVNLDHNITVQSCAQGSTDITDKHYWVEDLFETTGSTETLSKYHWDPANPNPQNEKEPPKDLTDERDFLSGLKSTLCG